MKRIIERLLRREEPIVSKGLFCLSLACLLRNYARTIGLSFCFTFILIMITTKLSTFLQLRRFPMMATTTVRYFGCDGAAGGTPEVIRQMEDKLKKAFEPTSCKIVDPVGDMNSIVIKIVSPKFQGMLPIARHRAINDLLKEEFKLIHAV